MVEISDLFNTDVLKIFAALSDFLDGNEEYNWFFLEIRFPPDTKYPYEAPFIYLKTTCHDLPRDILLLVARRLHCEARSICADGMGCVYSICEAIQSEEAYSQLPKGDAYPFPSDAKSLFANDGDVETTTNGGLPEVLPTHYERGQTSHAEQQRSTKQTENEDRVLLRKFLQRQEDERYRKMMLGRRNLPAFEKMLEILDLIEKSQVFSYADKKTNIIVKKQIIPLGHCDIRRDRLWQVHTNTAIHTRQLAISSIQTKRFQ